MTPSRVALRSMLRAELGELVHDWPASLVDEAVEICAGYGLTAAEAKRYARRLAERCAEVAWVRRMRECEALGRGQAGDKSWRDRG